MTTLPRTSVPHDLQWARRWASVDPMNVLHQPSPGQVQWTTVNLGEVFPGVPTPLNWAVLAAAGEWGLRRALRNIGVYAGSDIQIPDSPEQRTIGIVWGRAVANLDAFRAMGDRSPGTSGDAMEAQIFGSEVSAGASTKQYGRYPVVLAKMPYAAWAERRKMLKQRRDIEAWWEHTVFAPTPPDRLQATDLMWQAYRKIGEVFVPHNVVMMLALSLFTPIRQMAAKAGLPGLESKLLYTGDTEESHAVRDLWLMSRQQLDMATFLKRHGFHGPMENEVSSRVWREDDSPLRNLVQRYADMEDSASPLLGDNNRLAERELAEKQLNAALGSLDRLRLKPLLALARKYVPLREAGRDNFLKGMDVVRYCARIIGADLVSHGLLDDAEDAFYLTPDELTELPADLKARAALRREKRAEYQQLELPERWLGEVVPVPRQQAEAGEVKGIGASAGVVEGRVRVVLDPSDDDLEDGEILVCRTTDPGWASYFFIAAGVVIDIGGPLSHGAIIARELGLPCVINARNATASLRSGDLVRIDGTEGSVTVLERATESACA